MKRQRVQLGELCTLVKGTSPISKTPPGSYLLVTTGAEHKTADTFQFDAEAVCIPLISSTGHGHASLKRVHYQTGKFALANLLAAALIKNPSLLSAKFLARYLMFTKDWLIVPLMTGAANMSISIDRLATVPIVFPSLGEQQRIVKLLDSADELRKLRAQADRRTTTLMPALFQEMFGDPVMNSKEWPVKTFGEISTNQDGRRKPVKALERAQRKGKYPYYGASGIIDYVDEYLFNETALLIGEDGANLLARSTPIAFIAHGKYWVNNHAHVITGNGRADLNYLCMALNLRRLDDYVTGSAQPKLNQANMNRIPIPLPPLPLQKEFAKSVSEIRALEAAQAASRKRLDDLFQSSLHRAFSGEL